MESWSHGVMESWSHGVMESWSHYVIVSWYQCVSVSWRHGVMVSLCHCVMVSWCHGVMVSWCHGVIVSWCHCVIHRPCNVTRAFWTGAFFKLPGQFRPPVYWPDGPAAVTYQSLCYQCVQPPSLDIQLWLYNHLYCAASLFTIINRIMWKGKLEKKNLINNIYGYEWVTRHNAKIVPLCGSHIHVVTPSNYVHCFFTTPASKSHYHK